MQANQYACISVEVVKENFKFQLVLPMGCSWELCESSIDDLKSAVLEMKRVAQEQAASHEVKE